MIENLLTNVQADVANIYERLHVEAPRKQCLKANNSAISARKIQEAMGALDCAFDGYCVETLVNAEGHYLLCVDIPDSCAPVIRYDRVRKQWTTIAMAEQTRH
jgi:hypothetical protein